jgi:hypothetical protein
MSWLETSGDMVSCSWTIILFNFKSSVDITRGSSRLPSRYTLRRHLKNTKKNHWGTLVPRINAENACIQQISFYVFLYIHAVVRHVTLFVWVHYYNYLLLTTSFSCTLSYMQHDYYQRTSYQCVTSYAGSLAIVLRCVRLYVRWHGSCISPP